MKGKCFMLGVAAATVGRSVCFADYIAKRFVHPLKKHDVVLLVDASKGKDSYVIDIDEKSGKFYMDKVEKNKPSDEDKSDNDRDISVRNEKIEKNKSSNKNKSDNDRYISVRNSTLQKAR